jgi:hypothetical protein
MAQHFLLSAAARTLSLKGIYSGGEEAAYETFKSIRWTTGEATCPKCGCCDTYEITQLIERLAEIGVDEKEVNVRNKLSRGKFTAAFLLQCLEAIGSETLHLS